MKKFRVTSALAGLFLFFSFSVFAADKPDSKMSLQEARRGFKTTIVAQPIEKSAVQKAPPKLFLTVKYPAPDGELSAYVTPNPADGRKLPAIIWIVGGDCNSIDDVWSPQSRENDQSAATYRAAGIVMMFPSLRGGNDNPGTKEGFLGEVDDVLAAAQYLAKLDYVDPNRIYLGGHSTGGTLALLVAESSDRFRAVFSFGPVANVAGYGTDSGFLPFDISNEREVTLRSPGMWLHSIRTPVWVFEGNAGTNNLQSLRFMARTSQNPNIHFIEVPGTDHFSTLAPTNDLIRDKILQDVGAVSNISITKKELNRKSSR